MAGLALEYRHANSDRERGRERTREATPHIQERRDCGKGLDPWPEVPAISVCVEIVETPHADHLTARVVYSNSQAVPETPGQYPGAEGETSRLLAAFAGTLCKAKPPARNERGRSRQVYNHHPYPYTRTYVLANTCSIFWPHTEHMFDTVKPENPCYFFAHPYRRFFRNTGPIGSRRIRIPKPSHIKNSILFFIFIIFSRIFLRL